MDELINDMKRKGLVSFVTVGKAYAVFDLLNLMATTEPYELNEIDWACRLALVRN